MSQLMARESCSLFTQTFAISKEARAEAKQQTPKVLWFTGLSGSGKSTIANLVEQKLYAIGKHTYILDGDNVRNGLNKDLSFTETDRVENIRRVAEVAKLMVDAGLIVLVTFISPFRGDRAMARNLFGAGEFSEIYVNVSLEVAELRDTKGLYRLARNGKLQNFTGISSPYEAPDNPELVVHTAECSPEHASEQVFSKFFAE